MGTANPWSSPLRAKRSLRKCLEIIMDHYRPTHMVCQWGFSTSTRQTGRNKWESKSMVLAIPRDPSSQLQSRIRSKSPFGSIGSACQMEISVRHPPAPASGKGRDDSRPRPGRWCCPRCPSGEHKCPLRPLLRPSLLRSALRWGTIRCRSLSTPRASDSTRRAAPKPGNPVYDFLRDL
jgi:hypothetical protein